MKTSPKQIKKNDDPGSTINGNTLRGGGLEPPKGALPRRAEDTPVNHGKNDRPTTVPECRCVREQSSQNPKAPDTRLITQAQLAEAAWLLRVRRTALHKKTRFSHAQHMEKRPARVIQRPAIVSHFPTTRWVTPHNERAPSLSADPQGTCTQTHDGPGFSGAAPRTGRG